MKEKRASNLETSARIELPDPMQTVRVRGLAFYHRKTGSGGDLYVIPQCRNLVEHFKPEHWMGEPRERFDTGTRPPFRVHTKTPGGESIPLIVKRSRHGEKVPFDAETDAHMWGAFYNSPFDEFRLVSELRTGGPPLIRTERPLAIYIAPAPKKETDWKTGRKQHLVHQDHIDMARDYYMLYGSIEDMLPAHQAFERAGLDRTALRGLRSRVAADLAQRNYGKNDLSPDEIMITPEDARRLKEDPNANIPYVLVDFEMLHRTRGSPDWMQRERRRTESTERKIHAAALILATQKHNNIREKE